MEAISEYSNSVIADRFLNAFSPLMHELDLNWLFFARHIEKKTRLLDVSRNPLVALYFACGKVFDSDGSELHKDGVVYFFQTSSYRPIKKTYVDPLDRRDFPTLPISYSEFLSPDFDPRVGGEVPYLIFPDMPQERILAQQGSFYFWKDPNVRLVDQRQLFPVIIDANAKVSIRGELDSFGISQETLFPNG